MKTTTAVAIIWVAYLLAIVVALIVKADPSVAYKVATLPTVPLLGVTALLLFLRGG